MFDVCVTIHLYAVVSSAGDVRKDLLLAFTSPAVQWDNGSGSLCRPFQRKSLMEGLDQVSKLCLYFVCRRSLCLPLSRMYVSAVFFAKLYASRGDKTDKTFPLQ